MTARYRDNVVSTTGPLLEIDQAIMAQIAALPQKLADAYGRCALQECASLPIELVRAIDGYIEATAPFKLAKDPTQSARLDTVLSLLVRGIYTALVGLLPILPSKAVEGTKTVGCRPDGKIAF